METSEIYEWYMTFEELKKYLIPDIQISEECSGFSSILVAGSGNSSICEDLYKAGLSPLELKLSPRI